MITKANFIANFVAQQRLLAEWLNMVNGGDYSQFSFWFVH